MEKAKYVTEITVIDPDSKLPVQVSIFKHQRGGMFGVDSSFIEQVLDDGDDGDCVIPDPFEVFEKGVFISNDGVKLTGV